MPSAATTTSPGLKFRGRKVSFSMHGDDIPALRPQFFYSSHLSIDDPLAAVPATTGAEAKLAKLPAHPFGPADNEALEEAWLSLSSRKQGWKPDVDKAAKVKTALEGTTLDRGLGRPAVLAATSADKWADKKKAKEARKAAKAALAKGHDLTPTHLTGGVASDIQDIVNPPSTLAHPAEVTIAGAVGTLHPGIDAPPIFVEVEDGTKRKHRGSKRPKNDQESKHNKKALKHGHNTEDVPQAVLLVPDELATVPVRKDSVPCPHHEHHGHVLEQPTVSTEPSTPSSTNEQDLANDGVCCPDIVAIKPKLVAIQGDASKHGEDKVNIIADHIPGIGQQADGYASDIRGDEPGETLTSVRVPMSEAAALAYTVQYMGTGDQAQGSHAEHIKHDNSKIAALKAKVSGLSHEIDDITAHTSQNDGADDGYFAKMFTKSKQKEPSQQQTPTIVVGGFDTPREDKPTSHETPASNAVPSMPPNTPANNISSSMPSNEPPSIPPTTPAMDIPVNKSIVNPPTVHDGASETRQPTLPPSSLSRSIETGTTGQPFVKLPSRPTSPAPLSKVPTSQSTGLDAEALATTVSHSRDPTEEQPVYGCKAHKKIKVNVDVPVGVSRLHLVKLPDLQLAPIYWSPVHDTAVVTRGTWFYRDTMLPVEPAVANQLEMGYRELRPWSQTWQDELRSALDVGAIAEEKVVHRLWPSEEFLRKMAHQHHILSTDAYCAASCFLGEASAEGHLETEENFVAAKIVKKYSQAHVVYKDSKHAFILKSSLQPSAYHGRRPIQKIMKGTPVGIPVIRGFDRNLWEKLHPSKKSALETRTEEKAAVGGDPLVFNHTAVRAAIRSHEERTTPTDLILVIHGIGQKLSERVESFHFTHAINALRRSIHMEMAIPAVQKVLRKDIGGIMVLPVNWRSNLSFDTGTSDQATRDFSLKDITPDTIPAVRNMISDVMLDIPFYMSNHKPKIIEAVVMEANRVYRLWCKNNPGFEKTGRVHIIAHSLGCAMAMEILSKQPTIQTKLDLTGKKPNKKFFDFKTVNLFFAGSPAGFFLFLEEHKLVPRKNQKKPGAELGDDHRAEIVGEAGRLGCLAVDNIYNVLHYNDPIAYRLNAAVDVRYAEGLKVAQLPNTSLGFFESLVKAITPGSTRHEYVGGSTQPTPLGRLPSQLEMEVHDFSREEIAEKKFYLLNDNGQIDWYTNAGLGMLDNQYINMLGAHSSYWTSLDFIRLVVIECGRKPGRSNALPNMKAVKASTHKK